MTTLCTVCNATLNIDKRNNNLTGNYLFFSCPRCGEYKIDKELYDDIGSNKLSNDKKSVLVSYLRQAFESGRLFELTSSKLKEIIDSKTLDRKAKIKLLMRKIDKETSPGKNLQTLYNNNLLAIQGFSGILNEEEYKFYRDYLAKIQLIDLSGPSNNNLQITFQGYEYLDSVSKENTNNIFCAMWFDKSMSEVWIKAMKAAIEEASYKPIRIDEVIHSEDINDRVLNEIKDSRLVIADFTNHRGGVYFEAGYAKALGKPVIHCCNYKDREKLHFDIRNINTIFWKEKELEKFKSQLLEAIKYLS